jgi:hypothetical protein
VIVYLAGKYSGEVDANIASARKIAIELWEKGYTVVCPHLNTAHFEVDCSCRYDDYMNGDYEIIGRCDAVVMLPNWHDSPGAKLEFEYAILHDIEVTQYPILPSLDKHKETSSQTAERIVRGARQKAYGHPRQDFARTAGLWTAILRDVLKQDSVIDAERVALMMVLLKLSRLIATPQHKDSLVDAHGYLNTYEMLKE